MDMEKTEENPVSRPANEEIDQTDTSTKTPESAQEGPIEKEKTQSPNECITIDGAKEGISVGENVTLTASNEPIDLSTPEPTLEQGQTDNLKRKVDADFDVSMASSPGRIPSPESQDMTIENDIKRFKIDSSQTSMVQNETPIPTQTLVNQDPAAFTPASYSPAPGTSDNSQNNSLLSHDQISDSTEGDNKPKKLTKREEERLAKSIIREAERVEREKKKEEERRAKQEEREKKELERKQKKELLEKEKQEKREQDKMKKELRRLKVEEEKKAKESERKAKEQERKKAEESKDRNQMRISSFFSVKPTKKESTPVVAVSVSGSRSQSPMEIDTPKEALKSVSNPDLYHSDFLPFFQKRNVLITPHKQLESSLLANEKQEFDDQLASSNVGTALSDIFTPRAKKSPQQHTTSQQMVDALNSSQMTEAQLRALVSNLAPIKYLQFYENAKPPYVGTWCSEKHQSMAVPATEPLNVSVTGYDYGYDSDLDWQEGDEGDEEDIDDLDEGDEEDEDAEDDEMEDFVENSDAAKRSHVGPLQSVTVWNDGSHPEIFNEIKYERLHLDITFPIDPFKDYWNTKPAVQAPRVVKPELQHPSAAVENPMLSLSQLGTLVKPVVPILEKANQVTNVLTPKKPVIQDEQVVKSLVEFIKKNSDFSLGTLAELAKKEFKVYTKSILKQTIQEVAIYDKKRGAWDIKLCGES